MRGGSRLGLRTLAFGAAVVSLSGTEYIAPDVNVPTTPQRAILPMQITTGDTINRVLEANSTETLPEAEGAAAGACGSSEPITQPEMDQLPSPVHAADDDSGEKVPDAKSIIFGGLTLRLPEGIDRQAILKSLRSLQFTSQSKEPDRDSLTTVIIWIVENLGEEEESQLAILSSLLSEINWAPDELVSVVCNFYSIMSEQLAAFPSYENADGGVDETEDKLRLTLEKTKKLIGLLRYMAGQQVK